LQFFFFKSIAGAHILGGYSHTLTLLIVFPNDRRRATYPKNFFVVCKDIPVVLSICGHDTNFRFKHLQ